MQRIQSTVPHRFMRPVGRWSSHGERGHGFRCPWRGPFRARGVCHHGMPYWPVRWPLTEHLPHSRADAPQVEPATVVVSLANP